MFSVNKRTGDILFPDGFTLPPPYNHERYFEYVDWVNAGNSPDEIESDDLLAEVDVEVTAAQARIALDSFGVYELVQGIVNHPDTPQSVKIKFEYTTTFRRNDPALLMIASKLEWGREKLDELFAFAKSVT